MHRNHIITPFAELMQFNKHLFRAKYVRQAQGYEDEQDNRHFQGTAGLTRETDPEIIAIQ